MAYANIEDIQKRITRELSEEEKKVCEALLDDAAVIIDAYNDRADAEAKKVVSCRLVVRAIGDGSESDIPIGATQGSQSALGYSQSWTISGSGSVGELYLGRLEKKLLGLSGQIGSYSPTEGLVRNKPEEKR